MGLFGQTDVDVQRELSRLARFGANIVDAHSCFIFIPSLVLECCATTVRLGSPNLDSSYRNDVLQLAGYHSLSNDILPGCSIPSDCGLIGWVAKHTRPIHVSPFEHDSRTLGVYAHDQALKSFMGVPVEIKIPDSQEVSCWGVVACDSKKAFAFSKLQGKLLEEFALEISKITQLLMRQSHSGKNQSSWGGFLNRANQLTEALSANSIEILRLQLLNFAELETELGTSRAIDALDQIERLIQQALPPHFPLFRLPNGDFLLALDNMMTSFYESKLTAICSHIGSKLGRVKFKFSRCAWRDKTFRSMSLEQLIAATAVVDLNQLNQGLVYEHRRA